MIKSIRIVYAQNTRTVLVKNTEDVTIGDKSVSVRLTQEETRRFSPTGNADIQVRILTVQGDALASDIIRVPVQDVLDNEVLV